MSEHCENFVQVMIIPLYKKQLKTFLGDLWDASGTERNATMQITAELKQNATEIVKFQVDNHGVLCTTYKKAATIL